MEELTTMLTGLADTLGTTVEYLWTVLLKQAYIQVIISAIIIIVSTIMIIISIKYTRFVIKNWQDIVDSDTEIGHIMINIILGIITIILFIQVVFYEIPELITAYCNPEFWALQEILNKL